MPEQRVKPEDEGGPCEWGIPGESQVPDSAPIILLPMASAPQPMAWAGALWVLKPRKRPSPTVVGESTVSLRAGYSEPCGGGMPSGFRDPKAVLGEWAVRSGTEPPFALPFLVAAPAPVFLALPGHLTFDWVDPRTLTEEGEREATPL